MHTYSHEGSKSAAGRVGARRASSESVLPATGLLATLGGVYTFFRLRPTERIRHAVRRRVVFPQSLLQRAPGWSAYKMSHARSGLEHQIITKAPSSTLTPR